MKNIKRNKVTFDDIEHDINCNDNLDSVFRESLAEALEKLNYLSDSQLNLICGTDEQQQEIDRVYTTPLKASQIKEVITFMDNKMKGDFQYKYFKGIVSKYMTIASDMEKIVKKERLDSEYIARV